MATHATPPDGHLPELSGVTEKGQHSPPENLETSPDEEKQQTEVDGSSGDGQADQYLSGKQLVVVFSGLLLSIMLIALDQTIVATALPRIVSSFDQLKDVTWIPTAYLLTQSAFMLPIGQVLTICPTKYVYLCSIALFELGSLLCGVSTSINFLIAGRAVAGCGASGINISVICIVAQIAKLEHRPALYGLFAAVYAIASVVGPLLGGAFTDRVSWRWCFYINLPLGAVAIAVVTFVMDYRPVLIQAHNANRSLLQRWLGVDWTGSVLCLGMVVTLLIPLQFGGNTRPWDDRVVIALLCVSAVLLLVFVLWERYMGDRAVLPLHIFKRRTQIGTAIEAFFTMYGLLVGTYYLPLWYQAQGRSAIQSGIDILPFLLSIVIAAGLSGACINFTGRYWPFMIGSPLVFAVGSGLLYTLDGGSSHSKLIGFQIICGIGIGGTLQLPEMSTQAEYANEEEMIPQASSMISFLELLGGVVGLAIAGSVFYNQLSKNIATYAPGLPSSVASSVRQSVSYILTLPPTQRAEVVRAYVRSLDQVFLVGVPAGVLGGLGSLVLVKNHDLKNRAVQKGEQAEDRRSVRSLTGAVDAATV